MKRVHPFEDYCIACRHCELMCQLEHSNSRDLVQLLKDTSSPSLKRIFVLQQGPVALALNCRHCDEPHCAYSCVAGALIKDPETGFVHFNQDKCIGCWTCIVACPYGVIVRNPSTGRIAKCDMCPGRAAPACVEACPNGALALAEA